MLNRKEQPELVDITSIEFIAPKKHQISEDVVLYHMSEVPNETSKIELYFNAGKCTADKGLSSIVNGLLLSGTKDRTSIEINESINGLGGFYESGVAMENSAVTIYALRENLIEIFASVQDAIENLAFIEQEVEQLIADRKQSFKIGLEKVGTLARRKFQQELFASSPRYSSVMSLEHFDEINIDDLKSYHSEYYLNGLQKVVVVGDLSNEEINRIIDLCKRFTSGSNVEVESTFDNTKGRMHETKKGAMQSALRIGRPLFNKRHEDYLDFIILNTLLGDYFGSRLMSNIREDKGYTYGIGSIVAEFKETGYFLIATEVGVDVLEDAISEIRKEIERLQNELVPEEELSLVKNYMLGQLLKSADGPYAMTDLFLSAESQELDIEFYNKAIENIHRITPERIKELANKYLNWEDFTIVSAG